MRTAWFSLLPVFLSPSPAPCPSPTLLSPSLSLALSAFVYVAHAQGRGGERERERVPVVVIRYFPSYLSQGSIGTVALPAYLADPEAVTPH